MTKNIDDIKILAIETSGKVCSVALSENNIIQCEYNSYEGNKHDKFTAEFCRRLLHDNDITVDDLSAIAVSIGPGSFTGLRIGTAIAKGFTFDNSPKLIAVPTLSAIALNAASYFTDILNSHNILSIIHSHSDLFYYQEFSAVAEQISDIGFTNYEHIKHQYMNEKIIIASNQKIDIDFGIKNNNLMKLTASMIASYAYNLYENNIFAVSADLVPMYIQEFIPKDGGKK